MKYSCYECQGDTDWTESKQIHWIDGFPYCHECWLKKQQQNKENNDGLQATDYGT